MCLCYDVPHFEDEDGLDSYSEGSPLLVPLDEGTKKQKAKEIREEKKKKIGHKFLCHAMKKVLKILLNNVFFFFLPLLQLLYFFNSFRNLIKVHI